MKKLMESNNFSETVKKITRLILTNQKKMIRKEDLKNLCEKTLNFGQIIDEIQENLSKLGFELISTNFFDQKYYILTSEGKDDNITPSQYGTLALILAFSKEVDENIKLDDLKELFSEVWDSDVEFLIEHDYIRQMNVDDYDIVRITPLGKAALKNIIQNINLKSLLKIFKSSES